MVPMRGADGTLLGVVSVDEPIPGLRPTDEELDVLVAFAEHVIGALEAVQDADAAARDRASLAQLLDVSASLVELDSADDVLRAVARGIKRHSGSRRSRSALPTPVVSRRREPPAGRRTIPGSTSSSPTPTWTSSSCPSSRSRGAT